MSVILMSVLVVFVLAVIFIIFLGFDDRKNARLRAEEDRLKAENEKQND